MEKDKIEASAKDLVESARDSSRTIEEVFSRSIISTLNHPANMLSGMSLADVLREFLPVYREAIKLQDKASRHSTLTFVPSNERTDN